MTDLFTTVESVGLVDLVARATIVLLLSLALQWLTRRRPAAIRHHLWTLAFALLLALPFLRLFGPSWDVRLFPRADGPSEELISEALDHGVPAYLGGPAGTVTSLVTDAPLALATAKTPPPWRLPLLAFVLWGIGSGAALVSVGVGAFRFCKLVRAGQPVENEAWLRQLGVLRRQLAIRADVRLVLGSENLTPMTGGVRNPVIVLPASAATWPEARRHVVLAHELIHVRRRDALRQLVGRAVLAIYWFHPLSWVASRLAAARREEACDEEVLAAGARPSEYARHLLSLAEGREDGRAVLSLPMVRRSQLETRIRAILKPHRARPRALVTAIALTAVAVVGVSASVANPIRPGRTLDPVSEGGAPAPLRVDCALASDADRPSGRVFTERPGDPIVCTIQGDVVTNDSGEVRIVGSDEWAVLETEIRNQTAQYKAQGSVRTRKAGLPQPAREWWAGKTSQPVEAEVDPRHGLSPR